MNQPPFLTSTSGSSDMPDWLERPFGELASVLRRGTAPAYVDVSSVRAIGQRCIRNEGFDASQARPHDARAGAVVPPQSGDVLINSTGTGTIGRSCVFRDEPGEFMVDGHVTLVRPEASEADGRFLNELVRSPNGQRFLESHCFTGSTNQIELSRTELSSMPVLVPPLEEQRRIAEILDTIDETIQATERVIAKMELRVRGLMQHTFGGSTWESSLETVSVGSLLRQRPKNGKSPVESDGWQGAFMLGLGCLRNDGFAPEQLKFAPALDSSLSSALLEHGDVLVSRSNTRDRVGYVGRYQDVGAPCIYPDLMMRLSVGAGVSSRFLELALQSEPARRQIEAAASGTSGSMVKITGSTVMGLPVPLVPLPEQLSISALFDEHAAAVAGETRTVAKLRHLRHGLAADLLSGRVRPVAT